jgi:formyltetrahydrofolate-dependent phosphoribosylglycinamide formyltransferase
MLALIRAGRSGAMPATVELVYGANQESPALEAAKSEGIAVVSFPDREEGFGPLLLRVLREHHIDLICLAGYLRLLPAEVLAAYPHRVLNIHPALLPKFGGKGMYGSHVHEVVLASGDAESGCTVHFVTEVYDEGAIVHQRRCPIVLGDTIETLAARVLEQEHMAYPEAVALVLAQL